MKTKLYHISKPKYSGDYVSLCKDIYRNGLVPHDNGEANAVWWSMGAPYADYFDNGNVYLMFSMECDEEKAEKYGISFDTPNAWSHLPVPFSELKVEIAPIFRARNGGIISSNKIDFFHACYRRHRLNFSQSCFPMTVYTNVLYPLLDDAIISEIENDKRFIKKKLFEGNVMRIDENDIKRMVSESVRLLTEKMQVWGDEDINAFIRDLYADAQEITEKANAESEFKAYETQDGYIVDVPTWRPVKNYVVNYQNIPMEVVVYFNLPPKQKYGGLHHSNSKIELFLEYNPSLEWIKDVVYHEFNHEFSQRLRSKGYRSPYYNMNTFDLNINGKPWTNKMSKAVDEVLYQLWSRDERDSFISHVGYMTYRGLKDYIEGLSSDIDILEKEHVTYRGQKTDNEQAYDVYFWDRIKKLASLRAYKGGERKIGDFNELG